MRTVAAGRRRVAAAAASTVAETAANHGVLITKLPSNTPRNLRSSIGGALFVLTLALLIGAALCKSVPASLVRSFQTDETDRHARQRAEAAAAREPKHAYSHGKMREAGDTDVDGDQTPNLLDLEVSGARDLRQILEDKEISGLIFGPNKGVEAAFNEFVHENSSMLFACSWDTEHEEAEVEMKRGRFLGVSNNALAFEVITAEDDALFMMKMGLIDSAQDANTTEEATLRFIKSETVLNTLLPEESPEMLLTRGFVVPLAIGKLKNFPEVFPLSDKFDSTNTVSLYPMVTCSLRHLIDHDLLVTHTAKMYFTVRLLSLLAWLHARGVIHLDVRPEHMMVTSDGHGFLGGLENSAPVDTMVKSKTSPGYVAPEVLQLRRRRVTGSSWHVSAFEMDAWAAGITIYQIWCGRPPMGRITESNMVKVYRTHWGKPWDYSKCGSLPTVIVGLIDGLLAWEEEARLLPVEIFEESLLEPDE